jgi:hypothetical protein
MQTEIFEHQDDNIDGKHYISARVTPIVDGSIAVTITKSSCESFNDIQEDLRVMKIDYKIGGHDG